ncbi:hypothetical protein ABIF72_003824 [Bradyrhizobium japonicum]
MRWVGEYSMPSLAASPLSLLSSGMPKNEGRRNAGDAVGAAGEALPVDDDEADDLAEGERHDGEIVAAQAQHGEAEQHAPERGEDAGKRQADPERPAEIGGKQRVGIGAHRVEGDVAEIEQAGEPDHDVQPPAQHHIGEHEDREIEDIALVIEDHRHKHREDQKSGRQVAAQKRHAAAYSRWHQLVGAAGTNPLSQKPEHDRAAEHGGNEGGDLAEAGPIGELAVGTRFGADADHQREQHQRDQGVDEGRLQQSGDVRCRFGRIARENCHAATVRLFRLRDGRAGRSA